MRVSSMSKRIHRSHSPGPWSSSIPCEIICVTHDKVLVLFQNLIIYKQRFLHSDWLRPCQLIPTQCKQEAISQKEIVFRFRKDIQSEKGWRFDILCMRSPGVTGICADALLSV